jgi:hypothetical protein
MNIIVVSLPEYFDSVCILIQKIGHQVYYLKLSSSSKTDEEKEKQRVLRLKSRGILPLPLADLPRYQGISDIEIDPEMKAFSRTLEISSLKLLHGFKGLFPRNTNIEKKLQIAVHSTVSLQQMYVVAKINIWARVNPDKKNLLIDFSLKGLLNPKLAPNVRQVIVPLSIFEKGLRVFFELLHTSLLSLQASFSLKKESRIPNDSHAREFNSSRVAFVTHQGLKYGNIFQKDLFYSTRTDSELHPERLLHIDYSGVPNPSEKIKWVCLGNQKQSLFMHIYFALIALCKGIPHIRHIRHIFGLIILTRFYVGYRSYSSKLDKYPDLKIALIDYDVLCPKDLILAFEEKGIITIATQERFVSAFGKLFTSTIIKYYLCNSPLTAEALLKNPITCVDYYIPVGQYRTDKLLERKRATPPQILKAPIAKGRKIITALGYHTQMEWHNSQVDLLINWKTHQQFLDDMIQLSNDIPDIFIILRYKNVDWMSLPIFNEIIQKINSSENIIISTDYSKDFFSYDICAHSDLVIAKYTSLADECLSVGIPVLFHEYTHNTERILADVFDYNPAKIMCFNYQELLERAKIVINGKPNTMIQDYEYLKNVVYGGLSDGRVKERIHKHIEELLSKL